MDALEEVQPGLSQKRGLEVVHASLLDLSSEELAALVAGADAVVQCLGHNLTFRGLWLPPYLLVKTACERLTAAVAESGKPRAKFVLMGSDGAAHPGEDDPRSLGERALLAVMRALLPPVRDNEAGAAYMHGLGMKSGLEWTVLRPTDMKNGEAQPYTLYVVTPSPSQPPTLTHGPRHAPALQLPEAGGRTVRRRHSHASDRRGVHGGPHHQPEAVEAARGPVPRRPRRGGRSVLEEGLLAL